MERRSLLKTVAGGTLVLTAGCVGPNEQETTTTESNGKASGNSSANQPGTDSSENQPGTDSSESQTGTDGSEKQTVSVTKRIESQSGLERVFKVSDGGDLDYELTCPDGTQKTASGAVTADEWAALEEVVVSLDRDRVQEKYECTSDCPQDIPPKHIEITVDESTVSTIIEVSATIPTDLTKILNKIDGFEETLQKPTCG